MPLCVSLLFTGLSRHALPYTCDHFAIDPLGSCGIEGCWRSLWGLVEVTDLCFSSVFPSKGVQPLFGSQCRLARRLSRHKHNTTVSAMAALARTVASPGAAVFGVQHLLEHQEAAILV